MSSLKCHVAELAKDILSVLEVIHQMQFVMMVK